MKSEHLNRFVIYNRDIKTVCFVMHPGSIVKKTHTHTHTHTHKHTHTHIHTHTHTHTLSYYIPYVIKLHVDVP